MYTEISIADDGIGNFFVSKVIRKFAIWSQAHVFVSGRYSEERADSVTFDSILYKIIIHRNDGCNEAGK